MSRRWTNDREHQNPGWFFFFTFVSLILSPVSWHIVTVTTVTRYLVYLPPLRSSLQSLHKVDFIIPNLRMQKLRLEDNLRGQGHTAYKGQNSNTVLSDFKVYILSTYLLINE